MRVPRWQRWRAVTAVSAVLSLGWGFAYWFHEAEFRDRLNPWTLAINSANVWLLEQDTQLRSLGLPYVINYADSEDALRFYFSQGLPLGFALAALFWCGWIATTTRPAGGRSFCDWFLAREPQVAPGTSVLPWGVRVVRDLSAGWLRYGLWALCVWAVASAWQMRSFDALYQRQFLTHTTDDDLWEDYQHALHEVRSDERAIVDLTERVAKEVD